MDVEIRTVAGSWLTRVDARELDRTAGSAAAEVRRAIQKGEPVSVAPLDGAEDLPLGRAAMHPAFFNPGHIVAVVEHPRGLRPR